MSSQHRIDRWNNAEPITALDRNLAECNHNGCRSNKLRWTPSGWFCKTHYNRAPDCIVSGCNEPQIAGQHGKCCNDINVDLTEQERMDILYGVRTSNLGASQTYSEDLKVAHNYSKLEIERKKTKKNG